MPSGTATSPAFPSSQEIQSLVLPAALATASPVGAALLLDAAPGDGAGVSVGAEIIVPMSVNIPSAIVDREVVPDEEIGRGAKTFAMAKYKYGTFSETGYLGVGDEYGKTGLANPKDKGPAFYSGVKKEGKLNDAAFDKFKPLFEGEPYNQDAKTKEAIATKKKGIQEHSWKPSSPARRGPVGSHYGTIGKLPPHEKEFDLKELKKGDIKPGPRNIVTCPPKKGTYGVLGTTLGEKQGTEGVAGEYKHMPEDYEMRRRTLKAELAAERKARVSDKPFKPSSPAKHGGFGVPGTTLSGKGQGVVGEYKYIECPPEKAPPHKKLEAGAFKPSSPAKSGPLATLSKFPEYIPDPETERIQREKAAIKAHRERLATQPKFVPPNVAKSTPTVSIVRKNL
eukprot:jgi/Mesvir1/528/Mv11389-RA.1